MVFDWQQHITRCVNGNKMVFSFNATAMEKQYQRLLVMKMMQERGRSKEYITNWLVKHDKESTVYISDIDHMLVTAEKIPWPTKKNYVFYITKNEIQYINALEYSKEQKAYLLGLVAMAKIMKIKKGLPTCNPRDRGYAWYIATGLTNYSTGSQKKHQLYVLFHDLIHKNIIRVKSFIKKVKRNDQYHTFEITNIILKADWVDFEATKGYKVRNIEKDIRRICDKYLVETNKKCSLCGKDFKKTPQSKTELCPECYMQYRREYKAKKQQVYSQNKKNGQHLQHF